MVPRPTHLFPLLMITPSPGRSATTIHTQAAPGEILHNGTLTPMVAVTATVPTPTLISGSAMANACGCPSGAQEHKAPRLLRPWHYLTVFLMMSRRSIQPPGLPGRL